MDRLKLYMRLVAVSALVVLGAVGVYKGRTILKGGAKTSSRPKMGKKTPDKTSTENSPDGQTPDTESQYGDDPNTASGNPTAGSENAYSDNETPDPNSRQTTETETGPLAVADPNASAYGDENEPQSPQPGVDTLAANENSAYGDPGAESSDESSAETTGDPSAMAAETAANDPGGYADDPQPAPAAETGSALDRLRKNLADVGQPTRESPGSESPEVAAEEPEPVDEAPPKAPKINPSNVRIPREPEEEPEPTETGAAGVVDRVQSAARNLFGKTTSPSRAEPDRRYADDPSTPPTGAKIDVLSLPPDDAEPESPPSVAPETERGMPTTPTPQPEVAPEQEPYAAPEPYADPATPEERAPVSIPKERAPRERVSPAPAASIPSTPIGGDRRAPRTLPDDGVHPNRIRSSASSGRMAEGPQSPNVVLEKFAPPEVQVGAPATFELVVHNLGDAPAHKVTVEEEIPQGTEYHSASPEPTKRSGRMLVWDLGSLQPDDEKGIRLQLTPVAEGEIALSAQVHFQAQADARSVATRPVLEVAVDAPAKAHAGDEVPLRITVTNQGSGAASDVMIEEDIPEGFTHPRGKRLQCRVGTLEPGKSKSFVLKMKAEEAGRHRNLLAVHAAGGIALKEETNIEVVAPSLKLGVSGSKRKYLDSQAIHVLTLENPGTAPANHVEVVAHLPRGLKFVGATNHGAYDASRHAVYWDLEQLPAGSHGAVQFTTVVEREGAHRIEAEARAAEGVQTQAVFQVTAEAASELPFTVSDLSDPIEIGEETQYEIRLANRGARDAQGVIVQAVFPSAIRPTGVDGDFKGRIEGNKVTFTKIERLAVGQGLVLRISAKAVQPGDHRIAVSVASDDAKTPVVHEEATRVYKDE